MPDAFEDLVREIVDANARHNPAWATTEGIPGFDHEVADVSRDAYAARIAEAADRLARLPAAEGGTAIDREALHFALALDLFNLERLRTWEKNPDLAAELMDHVFPLIIRVSRPLRERVEAMTARLEKAASFLERGRTRLDPAGVPPLWVDVAIESADQAPGFLDAVVAAAADAPEAARRGLEAAVRDADSALAAFRSWLAHDLKPVASGEWAIGEDDFDDLLRARLLPLTTDELWEIGEGLVAKHRDALKDAALTVLAERGREVASDPVREALDVVRVDHPSTFQEVVAAYRTSISDARAFTAARGVATVPSEAEAPLDVVETPAYLRHLIPFAAYVQPARFDAESRGTYLVTPKVDLSAFPVADIRNTTVHEAYPGHHLQLVRAKENPSLARFLVGAPETIEGWALYCESIMGRHGFTATPKERFVREKDALWRAVRVVLDVGLHTGRVTYGDAVHMLAEETGFSQEEAEAEVRRYTLSPAYNLSYLIGRLGIERLRAKAEAAPDFDERAFHDALLAQGSLPLPILERAVEGAGVVAR